MVSKSSIKMRKLHSSLTASLVGAGLAECVPNSNWILSEIVYNSNVPPARSYPRRPRRTRCRCTGLRNCSCPPTSRYSRRKAVLRTHFRLDILGRIDTPSRTVWAPGSPQRGGDGSQCSGAGFGHRRNTALVALHWSVYRAQTALDAPDDRLRGRPGGTRHY